MEIGETVVLSNKKYIAKNTKHNDNPCKDCVAHRDMGLCMSLPDCFNSEGNYVHFVRK